MSRITKEQKDAFVQAVMKSIPRRCSMSPSAVITELEKRYSAATPADVKAFMKKYPGCVEMVCPDLKGFPQHHVGEIDRKTPRWRYVRPTMPKMVKVEDVDFSDLIVAAEEYDAETLERITIENNLRAAISIFHTHEQIAKAYPELAKFLPTPPQRAYPVANTNLIVSLKKAGLKV